MPTLDPKNALDGQRQIQILRKLPVTSNGRRFQIRSKILGVYDKGKSGSVVETEQTLIDEDTATLYTRVVGSKFFVGQGNWGGPRGPSTPKYQPPEGREEDADRTSEIQLSNEIAHLYR